MWRYLKAAFFVGVNVPGLGRLPVNALAAVCFAILGVASHGFWFLGAGIEVLVVTALATNRRFQQVVDATAAPDASRPQRDADPQSRRLQLANQLIPPSRKKLEALELRCNRVLELNRNLDAEAYVIDSNRDALARLSWAYLKLLVARQYLTSQESQVSEAELRGEVAGLEKAVASDKLPAAVKESKAATLKIFQKRLEILARREQSIQEIDSDLTRVEAQVDLAVENATMRGQPQAIGSDIALSSHLLDAGAFGDSASAIEDLDHLFAPVKTM